MNDFANGVDPVRVRALYAVQGRISQTLFSTKTFIAAWHDKPSRYVVTTADRTTAPELQRFVAQRMKAKTIEVDSGHLSFLTHPRLISEFILGALKE